MRISGLRPDEFSNQARTKILTLNFLEFPSPGIKLPYFFFQRKNYSSCPWIGFATQVITFEKL